MLSSGVSAVDQSTSLSSKVLKENLQIKVYNALEKLLGEKWAKNLSTEQLIQSKNLSDQQLNNDIMNHLGHKINLPCVVGDSKCLYKDRASLIKGQITENAQKLID